MCVCACANFTRLPTISTSGHRVLNTEPLARLPRKLKQIWKSVVPPRKSPPPFSTHNESSPFIASAIFAGHSCVPFQGIARRPLNSNGKSGKTYSPRHNSHSSHIPGDNAGRRGVSAPTMDKLGKWTFTPGNPHAARQMCFPEVK